MCRIESIRLSINEHLTSVGEEILRVLEKQSDVCCVKLVSERLRLAAEFMFNLFQREMETLETLERRNKQLDLILQPHVKLHRADVFQKHEERSPNLVQEEPQLPQIKEEPVTLPCQNAIQTQTELPRIKEEQEEELLQRPETADGPAVTLLEVMSEGDDEQITIQPAASTSTAYMKEQAEFCGTLKPTRDEQLLSSHCSTSDSEQGGEWEETMEDHSTLNKLKSQNVEEPRLSLENKRSQLRRYSKQSQTTSSHKGKKTFICTECGKAYNRKETLNRHKIIHTGEKPFMCKVCGKCFNDNGNLKKHLITHSGEKPFMCTVCGKGYTHSCYLKLHMSIHTGETPFACIFCGKGFVTQSRLKYHMFTHTGNKPFTCPVCGKGFSLKNELNRHTKSHTGDKPSG